jgi:hypothetical protein
MKSMTLHSDGGPPLTRFTLPSRIFTPVLSRRPPGRFDNARAMLRHPGFWAVMAALTILMLAGALMLSEYFRNTAIAPVQNTGRTYSALAR